MNSIFHPKIKELIESGHYDSIMLAAHLLDDPQEICCLYYCTPGEGEFLGLPHIGIEHEWITLLEEVDPAFLSDGDFIYLKEKYEQYMES